MEELWKNIEGYEGRYQVSNMGRVKSIKPRGKDIEVFMSCCPNAMGYPIVLLSKDGKKKTLLVHRLVAKAFIPNPNEFNLINHKNEIKTDNRAENLEWCDAKYNTEYSYRLHPNVKANGKRVRCVETGVIYPSIGNAGFKTGIKYQHISRACRNKKRTAGSFHWEFVD